MNTKENARKLIEARIKNLLSEFDFTERREKFPNECPCYNGRPCHEISEEKLNCFLCYCPEYNFDSEVGGCKIRNPLGKGEWFYHDALPKEKIWDCSECNYPHDKIVAEKYLRKMFGLENE